MFAGSMLLSATLIAFAAWLHYNESHGWFDEERSETELDRQYLSRRTRSRRRTNAIIAICGVLIFVAGIAGTGALWVACWMTVSVALVTVIVLAGLDVLRTHRYHNAKLRDLVQRQREE